jgi:hypothetical protein
MTYHHEPRKPTMNEFLRSRGIRLNMRARTQAEELNDRMARFVTNAGEKKNLFQRVLDQLRDASDF